MLTGLAKSLGTLDLLIVAASLGLTMVMGFWASEVMRRKSKDKNLTVSDYIIMGRGLTLPLLTVSLVSSWYGGIFGVTAIAFDHGIFNFMTQGVFWYGSYLIFALFLVKRIRKTSAKTLPDLIGQTFGTGAAKIAAIFCFFNMLPVAYSLSLGVFIQAFLPVSLPVAIFLGTGFVIAYSAFGGMRADVYTDIVQVFLMYLSVGALVYISYQTFGGLSYLQSALPSEHFKLTGGNTILQTLVWGFIALSTLVDPTFYQRCFAAKDEKTARNGILISILFWMVFDVGTTLSGMYARAAMPDIAAHDSFLVYGLSVLPVGFKGLLIAGILATIMSTVDTFNFLAATTINHDLLGEKTVFHRYRYVGAVILSGLLSALIATMFDGSFKLLWKTMGSYWAGCLVVPLLWGLCRPERFTSRVFVVATLTAAAFMTWWRFWPRSGIIADIDELYIGLIITFIVFLLAEIMTTRFMGYFYPTKR